MVIILGNYIDFNIKEKRSLPSFNPAGSNRMLRLAQSLISIGDEAVIVSPACAMTMKWNGTLFHKQQIEIFQKVKIYFCLGIGLPIVGMIFEQIIVLLTIWKLSRKHKITGLIVYCYYPSSVWASLFAKYILRIAVIEDLEDICVPKLSDWKSSSEANPIQQLFGWFLMKIMIIISDRIIVPTSNFLPFIKNKNKAEIISGCIDVPILNDTTLIHSNEYPIRVLFSGAIEDENGVPLLIEFLKMVNLSSELSNKYVFDISGHGSKTNFLLKEIRKLANCRINFHGFLTEEDYCNLLSEIKIALVLQNPSGRYSNYKTPSKGYEYLSNSKTVIVSNIGDFGQLPEGVVIKLNPYNSITLFEIFKNLTLDSLNEISQNAYRHSKINWDSPIVGNKLNALLKRNK